MVQKFKLETEQKRPLGHKKDSDGNLYPKIKTDEVGKVEFKNDFRSQQKSKKEADVDDSSSDADDDKADQQE